MRILHVISSLSMGGAEVMLRKLIHALDRGRYSSAVASLTTRSPVGEQIESEGATVMALHARFGMLMPWHIQRLRDLARQHRPHVIHGWMYHGNIAAHLVRSLIESRSRPGLIVSVRGALHAPRSQGVALRMVRAADARLSRRADAVVYNSSRSAAQHAAIGYDAQRSVVIPNGFELDQWRPDAAERAAVRAELGCGSNTLVGLVARFNVLKGQRLFVEAAALTARHLPEVRFVLAGRGCDPANQELMGWVSGCGLKDRVMLLGERHDIRALNNALDIAVCASISESFPNSIGEAMACGVPCVVTDVGDCAVLVGDTGEVVSPGNPAALSQGMLRLAKLPAEDRRARGLLAARRVREHFGMMSVADQFARLYERVARRGD